MKTIKMSLASIGTLSRSEMKTIMAGSGIYDNNGVRCSDPVVDVCSFECPCTYAADWCVNNRCQKR